MLRNRCQCGPLFYSDHARATGVAPSLFLAAPGPRGVAFALLAAVSDGKTKLDQAAPGFHRVGRELHVDDFDAILASQTPANAWERRFFASLEREASNVRQAAVSRLSGGGDFIEKHRERIDRIGDGLTMVRQLGGHGLVPLFLILEDYRALT